MTLMKAIDVARSLAMSEVKVRRMMRSGEIPVVRIGRAVRVLDEDLVAWVRGHRTNEFRGSE